MRRQTNHKVLLEKTVLMPELTVRVMEESKTKKKRLGKKEF